MYLGHIASQKVNHQFKVGWLSDKPMEEWIIVKNTHEPIISQETYDMANEKVKSRKRPFKTGEESIFSGLVKCPSCGKSLNLGRNNSKNREKLLTCNTYRRYGKNLCSQHRIYFDTLYEIVLEDIRKNAIFALKDEKMIITSLEKSGNSEVKEEQIYIAKKIEEDSKRVSELNNKIEKLYDDWIDKKISESNFQRIEDIMKLGIYGIYIGGAYVGAGFVAACQSPEYLKENFKKNVDTDFPGVRFDIELKNNSLIVHTTMSKEITGFTNSVKDDINRRGFGFVFSSENAVFNGEHINHIMVYKARNLKLLNGNYEPIYKTQTANYIERVLRHATGDFKEENIEKFFSTNPSSTKSRWLSKKDCVNAIIASGDEITYNIDSLAGLCTIELSFNGSIKEIEVPINKASSN